MFKFLQRFTSGSTNPEKQPIEKMSLPSTSIPKKDELQSQQTLEVKSKEEAVPNVQSLADNKMEVSKGKLDTIKVMPGQEASTQLPQPDEQIRQTNEAVTAAGDAQKSESKISPKTDTLEQQSLDKSLQRQEHSGKADYIQIQIGQEIPEVKSKQGIAKAKGTSEQIIEGIVANQTQGQLKDVAGQQAAGVQENATGQQVSEVVGKTESDNNAIKEALNREQILMQQILEKVADQPQSPEVQQALQQILENIIAIGQQALEAAIGPQEALLDEKSENTNNKDGSDQQQAPGQQSALNHDDAKIQQDGAGATLLEQAGAKIQQDGAGATLLEQAGATIQQDGAGATLLEQAGATIQQDGAGATLLEQAGALPQQASDGATLQQDGASGITGVEDRIGRGLEMVAVQASPGVQLVSVQRAAQLRLVHEALEATFNVYRRLKKWNCLCNWSLKKAEASAAVAWRVAERYPTPLHFVDVLMLHGVECLERNVPAVNMTAQELKDQCMQRIMDVFDKILWQYCRKGNQSKLVPGGNAGAVNALPGNLELVTVADGSSGPSNGVIDVVPSDNRDSGNTIDGENSALQRVENTIGNAGEVGVVKDSSGLDVASNGEQGMSLESSLRFVSREITEEGRPMERRVVAAGTSTGQRVRRVKTVQMSQVLMNFSLGFPNFWKQTGPSGN